MRMSRRMLKCVVCGRTFYVTVPDWITPEIAELLRMPRCWQHRGFPGKNRKSENQKDEGGERNREHKLCR